MKTGNAITINLTVVINTEKFTGTKQTEEKPYREAENFKKILVKLNKKYFSYQFYEFDDFVV